MILPLIFHFLDNFNLSIGNLVISYQLIFCQKFDEFGFISVKNVGKKIIGTPRGGQSFASLLCTRCFVLILMADIPIVTQRDQRFSRTVFYCLVSLRQRFIV